MEKLSQSKEKLSKAFVGLEKAVLDKINEIKRSATGGENQDELENLRDEVSDLQKSLSDLEAENEALKLENKELRELKIKFTEIVSDIRTDLTQIKKTINKN
ncbi:MAG: hypothetical protein K0R25_1203 [Rickettsiaceae bacterium]|jgi:regulator of replication initiation timing|nr:hypothetical protein [Rickettsiaceae bacterium]